MQIFALVLGNRQVVENIYCSVNREQLENYLYAITYDLLIAAIDEIASGVTVGATDKNFIVDFYKYAFVSRSSPTIASELCMAFYL